MKLDPKGFACTVRCTDCGHEQKVTPACVFGVPFGEIDAYFGSSFSHCDKCDGPPVVIAKGPGWPKTP